MAAMIVETNWVTTLAQSLAMIGLVVSFWIAWKQYKYQKMESVEKANKQIEQNDTMIKLLMEISRKLNK